MTMRELAVLANVSVSTVSKAFHDAEDVSDETKKLIFDTAKQYGCFGKYYRGRFEKKVIAIICPELNSAYYNVFVRLLQNVIEKNNSIAVISSDHFSKENQEELIDYYLEQKEQCNMCNDDCILVGSVQKPFGDPQNL